MNEPLVTVAICTRGPDAGLQRCLESLSAQTVPRQRYEIVIVDNSPGPAPSVAADFLQREDARCLRELRPGLSLARNRALEACRSRCIAFIDDDATAAVDWLERILVFFDARDADAVAVGGRVVPEWESPRPAWLTDELEGHFSAVHWSDETIEISDDQWLAGANIAFRTDAARAAGGFRDGLGRIGDALLSNEETELIRRLGRAGGRSFYDPSILVTHHIGAGRTTPGWIRRRVAWQEVSEAVMAQIEAGVHPRRPRDIAGDDTLSRFTVGELLREPCDTLTMERQLSALKLLLRSLLREP